MGLVTYPVFFPFTGPNMADGSQIYDLLYDPSDPAASLSVINGNLERVNFDSGFLLEDIHTQRRSAVDVVAASANANLDFRPSVFGGTSFNNAANEQYEIPTLPGVKRTYIPGANVTHFYHWPDTIVIALWSVHWSAHSPADTQLSRIYFHIDGTIVRDTARNVASTYNSSVPTALTIDNYRTNYGFKKSRFYSGHYVTPNTDLIDGGWHSMGLGVIAEPGVSLTRVHARDIVVLAFRSAGS
jgi:hypothetical protein